MSDAYLGLLALSGIVLAVVAARGSGLRTPSRVVDALAAAGLLGWSAYLFRTDPPPATRHLAVLAVPAVLLIHAWRRRRKTRASRFAAGFTPQQPYAARPAPTPLTPFPPPPPPLGAAPDEAEPPPKLPQAAAEPPRRGPMPSGLPGRSPASPPAHHPGHDEPRHTRTRHPEPVPDDLPAHESGSRLRTPAFLGPWPAAPGTPGPLGPPDPPGPPGSGRHRAPDAAGAGAGAGAEPEDDPPDHPARPA